MICPKCDGPSKVADSRPQGSTIRRRRDCLQCGHRYWTLEISTDARSRDLILMDKDKLQKMLEDEIASAIMRCGTRLLQ